MDTNMKEILSAHAHDMWSGWMQYMFRKSPINKDGTMTIPAWAVSRWARQAGTNYTDLPEEEKESDRKEADKILKIIYSKKLQPLPPTIYGVPPKTIKCPTCGTHCRK